MCDRNRLATDDGRIEANLCSKIKVKMNSIPVCRRMPVRFYLSPLNSCFDFSSRWQNSKTIFRSWSSLFSMLTMPWIKYLEWNRMITELRYQEPLCGEQDERSWECDCAQRIEGNCVESNNSLALQLKVTFHFEIARFFHSFKDHAHIWQQRAGSFIHSSARGMNFHSAPTMLQLPASALLWQLKQRQKRQQNEHQQKVDKRKYRIHEGCGESDRAKWEEWGKYEWKERHFDIEALRPISNTRYCP